MAKRKHRHPYLRQAQAEALVQYGPELSGLLELQRQARMNLKSGVRAAKGSAAAITNAIDQAAPAAARAYSSAEAAQGVSAAQTAAHVESLGPVAAPFAQAMATEQQAAASRIRESGAAVQADLAQQRVSAQGGRAFGISQARSQFAEDIGKVLRQKRDLYRRSGAFTAGRLGDLRGDARDDARTERMNREDNAQSNINNLRSNDFDPVTGKPVPPKAKPKTQDQLNREARQHEKQITGWTRIDDVVAKWGHYSKQKGAQTDSAGNPIGKERLPTAEELEQMLLGEHYSKREIDIARDLIRNNGRLSRRGVKAMREIGLKVPKRWRPAAIRPQTGTPTG